MKKKYPSLSPADSRILWSSEDYDLFNNSRNGRYGGHLRKSSLLLRYCITTGARVIETDMGLIDEIDRISDGERNCWFPHLLCDCLTSDSVDLLKRILKAMLSFGLDINAYCVSSGYQLYPFETLTNSEDVEFSTGIIDNLFVPRRFPKKCVEFMIEDCRPSTTAPSEQEEDDDSFSWDIPNVTNWLSSSIGAFALKMIYESTSTQEEYIQISKLERQINYEENYPHRAAIVTESRNAALIRCSKISSL